MVAVVDASQGLKIFGNNVRIYRERKNMGQKELATAAGLKTHSVISAIENGTYTSLTLAKVYKLAEALGTTVEKLLGLTMAPAPLLAMVSQWDKREREHLGMALRSLADTVNSL